MSDHDSLDFLVWEESPEVLRCRFTKWLEILIYRVKINYLSDISKQTETLSLDELIDKGFQAEDPQNAYRFVDSDNSFSFNDDAIAEAVMKLPKKRRRILELLFIEGLKPIEVSEFLGCSLQHVYNRRSAAIKELRSALIEEDKKWRIGNLLFFFATQFMVTNGPLRKFLHSTCQWSIGEVWFLARWTRIWNSWLWSELHLTSESSKCNTCGSDFSEPQKIFFKWLSFSFFDCGYK